MTNCQQKHDNLNRVDPPWQALAFSVPSAGLWFLMGSMGVIQGIYAKHFGVALTTLAAILLVGRIFDAFSDPLIGYYSDSYRARTGTRKPFILLGGLALIPCSYFLFVPPDNVSLTYLTIWTLLFYLAYTFISIPFNAWASELTFDSLERTRLFAVMLFSGRIGGLLFYLVPFYPMFPTTEITPETLKYSVVVSSTLIILGLYFSLRYVPSGRAPLSEKILVCKPVGETINEIFNAVKSNKPFKILMVAYMSIALAFGMYGGLFFVFVDAYLGQGAAFGQLAIISILGALVLTPAAYKAVIILGKKKAWLISSIITLGGVFYAGQLSPGEGSFFDLLALKIVLVFGAVMLGLIVMPMLSDTVDYALLYDRTERRAAYFSVYSMATKAESALGISFGLAIAGWLGFDATLTSHSEQSSFAIHMAISWLPCVFLLLGLCFIWRYPLDERRTAIIHRRLANRVLREASGQLSNALIPKAHIEEKLI